MSQSTPKRIYLLTYNTLCTVLWAGILLAIIITSQSPNSIYTTIEPWTRWTQTLAVAEFLHAATVFARSVQVWAINYAFPMVTAASPAYPAMVFAWSIADVVRFSYFVVLLRGKGEVPEILRWLRYSLFLVLYPIGIGSEWWLMYQAATVTASPVVAGIFYFCLALYAPGAVMMYSYMVKQRRKTLSQA
ncbi:hypothetical protein FE257_007651 [Aspergillus nanangensis]|uniref:Very-long-chain (3R)-3-hydroxyacyl-CoA dehydratase n=1 Tax=Aspergillus nanangensis TaxID=2582783 RepID=A0AAD4CMR4_ASPNN|nr:hypothetical protein FE257_007651 [Aspergillus nanangensis]